MSRFKRTRLLNVIALTVLVASAMFVGPASPVGATRLATHWVDNNSQVDNRCGTAAQKFKMKVFSDYDGTGGSGPNFKICGYIDCLCSYPELQNGDTDWNDKISYEQGVVFYGSTHCILMDEHAYVQGQWIVIHANQAGPMPSGWNDRVSSIIGDDGLYCV